MVKIFRINDFVWSRSLNEEVKLMAIEYNPFNGNIKYIVDSKYNENVECDFYDLVDLAYI